MTKWAAEPQVLGKYIISIIKASEDKHTTHTILLGVGLKTIEPLKWYSQAHVSKVFAQLMRAKGDDYIYGIGKALIDQGTLPDNVHSFQSAVSALDLGYTIAHRNQTGAQFGQKSTSPLRLEIIAANPYPCPFDWGILQQLIARYAPSAKIA
ncbi:hypothetical protein KKF84_14845, partial [Myxococcota bacterium]|nr:hypothetical protein [Myxococcota bacterium]MBU1536601.1 hypothetical protein [Myxococcota bacterium]